MTPQSATQTHVRLEEFIEKPQYGLTASAVAESVGPKFLRITDIQDGSVDWNTVPFCDAKARDLRSELFLEANDIVVARIGATTGKAFLIESCPKAIFASYLMRIRTKNGLHPKFLYYFFHGQTYWRQIEQNKGGRLKGGINIPILQNLRVYLPSEKRQIATVATLDAIQTARNVRKKELELERERKAALMEHLFTRGTRNEPLKETEIGQMPISWEIKKLREVCSKTETRNPQNDPNQSFLYVDVSSVSNKSFRILGANEIMGANAPSRARKVIRVNDIIFATVRPTLQRIAKVPQELDKQICSTGFCVVRPVSDKANADFVCYYLQTKRFNDRIAPLQKGATYPAISDNDLLDQKIPLPAMSEQIQIGDVLCRCDRKIQGLESEMSLLDELFQAMLEELMSGRLSVESFVEEAA